MKRFRFPLRPVAVLRAHRQARAKEAFAFAVHAFVASEESLAAIRTRLRELEVVMQDGRRASFQATDEIAFWSAYRRVCVEELDAERRVIEARATMEKKRQEYLEAHRAVKVIDRLEQKAHTRYRLDTAREDQQELDELAGLRIARRLAESTVVYP